MDNLLYYGDNLDVLRRHVADESVDVVYADPPFKSDQNYNVLFKERDGQRAASQIRAFEDTWTWDQEDEAVYSELVTQGGRVADALEAFRKFVGPCDMLSYLVMMAPRLIECRRVMKKTGSMYLHCDQAASHYLKMLMDAVFGPENFRADIIWMRTSSHGNVGRGYGSITDNLLYYSRSDSFTWNQQFAPYSEKHIATKFTGMTPDGRRFTTSDLRNPGMRPNLRYDFTASNGITYKPHPNGWAVCKEVMEQYDREGRLYFPKKVDGRLRLKRYLDECMGEKIQNLWDDIPPINSQAAERLGYPTQKPEALLERIVLSSCPEDGVVMDPFCGCGTAVVVAEKFKRHWIGIDITHLAITLMKQRLKDTFGESVAFKVVGEPVSIPDAAALAASDPYQFQWWSLGLVGARPVEGKKGADKGIDGKIVFQGESVGKFESVIISVKAGGVTVSQLRDLCHVVDREKACIGVFISMQETTEPMRMEAVTAGFYESQAWGKKYPKIQLLTVAELLAGKQIDMPPIRQVNATFKKAPKAEAVQGEEQRLGL
jgi:site-specific DNA-methyltransferase (adenine-specific)